MATIIYYKGLDYDKLPTAKRRKTSEEPRQQYYNPAYHTVPVNVSPPSDYGSLPHETNLNHSATTYEPLTTHSYSSQENVERNRPESNLHNGGIRTNDANRTNGINGTNHYNDNNHYNNSNGNNHYNSSNGTNHYNNSSGTGIQHCRRPSFQKLPSQTPPDSKTLHDTLMRYFKFSAFRENQLESVNASCQGLDTLILMPTGGGKSICYQLPAILSNGLTIVVSPLKSLIADQVDRMQSLNVKTSALSGETKENEADCVFHDLRQDRPEHKLLYVTPEKINASNFLMSIFQQLYERNLLARFVIDEAHCVSTWGADFRPDYRKLGKLRNLFPDVPIMALTATAPPKVRDDILDQLGMDKATSRVFIQSFNRPNLKFEVRDKSKGCLEEICKHIRANFRHQCGIIYCLSRNDCEQVSQKLRDNGITSAPYHAGLSDESRKKTFAAWSRGTFQVVCATIAFGMGIDKSDVRFVIHYSMPKSIEGYYQEAGRAGRDGKTANCILYFSRSDLYRMKSMLNKTGFGRKAEDKKRDVGNLQHMIDYVDNKNDCRRAILLRYLGENFDRGDCVKRVDTTCDNCFYLIPRR